MKQLYYMQNNEQNQLMFSAIIKFRGFLLSTLPHNRLK